MQPRPAEKERSIHLDRLRVNREREVGVPSGWLILPIALALLLMGAILLFSAAPQSARYGSSAGPLIVAGLALLILGVVSLFGFFTLQPNEARVLILFGAYCGTVRTSGFHWGNPFYSNGPRSVEAAGVGKGLLRGTSRQKISLRARNLNGDRLKVNDKRGNPIEIAAVVVWRVQDTAQATFDVDDYEAYVRIQSESAVRHLASAYAYDHGEEDEITLRSNVEEVSQALRRELQERLVKAGVFVEEARLTHLAYAPEIASAMLRRQQAEAVIAARQKIVAGAVSMADMALRQLAERQLVELEGTQRAALVSNLMVVLCGEAEVHPIINAGTGNT